MEVDIKVINMTIYVSMLWQLLVYLFTHRGLRTMWTLPNYLECILCYIAGKIHSIYFQGQVYSHCAPEFDVLSVLKLFSQWFFYELVVHLEILKTLRLSLNLLTKNCEKKVFSMLWSSQSTFKFEVVDFSTQRDEFKIEKTWLSLFLMKIFRCRFFSKHNYIFYIFPSWQKIVINK